MRQQFVVQSFRKKTLKLIEQANAIIAEYQAEGYELTVRQLYYQFVARDLLANTQQNYQRLASICDDARKAGLMDWEAIVDKTRYLRSYTEHDGPEDAIRTAADGYGEALWADQDNYVELWIEKDALLGVIERPAGRWRVPYLACRGYASSSVLYESGRRFRRMARQGKECHIIHLGDHDPSGLDMSRVNDLWPNTYGGPVTLHRVALNMDQIREHEPPPNPAKETDSRWTNYVADNGTTDSWELDALSPKVIDGIIEDAVKGLVDEEKFAAALAKERANEALLRSVADRWDDVASFLKDTAED